MLILFNYLVREEEVNTKRKIFSFKDKVNIYIQLKLTIIGKIK